MYEHQARGLDSKPLTKTGDRPLSIITLGALLCAALSTASTIVILRDMRGTARARIERSKALQGLHDGGSS